ncbi:MAG TPA: ATP-binding protein [Polyangiaceae bacterium]|nr:ATP-binding protein [Polyangiaceae bacterium]
MPTEDEKDAALRALALEVEHLRAREERLRAENEHLLETQRMLEDNRDQYSDLFDYAPVAWLTIDDDGTIQNLNLVAVTLLGFGRSYLIGSPLSSLVHGEDRRRLMDHLFACQPGGEPISCEVRFTTRDGRHVPVRLSTRIARGRPEGYTIALLDLREREAAVAEHERLTASEREARVASEAKDTFMAMLSHELRTPLTPVLAAASALVEVDGLPSDVRSALAIVQRNVVTEAQLIDDLLDLARISHGKLRVEKRPVDAHETVLEALETLTPELQAKNLQVARDLSAPQHWVNGDATRLKQVFWNLFRNALKFTEEGGQLGIRSWNHEGNLLLEVSDNGRGIDADTLPRLFKPFEQGRDDSSTGVKGLGLGLPICRGILEQHGATIVASSQGPGKGARFVIEIEAIEPPTLAPRSTPPSTPAPPSRAVRVLLVEDHEDTAEIFELLLRRGGYEVRVANSLQSALAVDREEFDVLLSDVGLTDGSGLDLMRTLRKTGKVKGIALSGYGTEEDVRASREAGFAAHITKPVNFGALLEAIASLGGS